MFLLDEPFVSDFLVRTIKENGFPLVSTPAARGMVKESGMNWISEEEAVRAMEEHPGTRVYTNSENALAWMAHQPAFSRLSEQAGIFKDKARFRELIRDLYPGFFFRTVSLEEIQYLDPGSIGFPFVIKPSVGFFSLGVHVVKNAADWNLALKELDAGSLKSRFPSVVLDTSVFIVEEYAGGEEYAVDCYFDQEGRVVILNILHHRFSSGSDTSDRVYTTSREIVQSLEPRFADFLSVVGKRAGLSSFPAHVELRMDGEGVIIPIEVNPLRFGGFCTTADLAGIALGHNPYACYFENRKPDWDEIFSGREDRLFSLVVLNNNSGYSAGEIKSFDYALLASDFEKPLEVRQLDIRTKPVFGFVFAETSTGNEAELERILVSDLRKYIEV